MIGEDIVKEIEELKYLGMWVDGWYDVQLEDGKKAEERIEQLRKDDVGAPSKTKYGICSRSVVDRRTYYMQEAGVGTD